MDSFRQHLQECLEGVPATTWDPSTIGDRNELNNDLDGITMAETQHPEVAYEEARQHLQTYGIELPPVAAHADDFLEEDGEIILPLVSEDESLLYFYFAFSKIDENYEIFGELLTVEELEEILDDGNDVDPFQ